MKNSSTSPMTKSSRTPLSVDQKSPSKESSINEFESLYTKNDFKGAAQYLLNNKQQMKSGIFHYNLGTVYSKMGDHATARYHLEKAIQEGYVNSASLSNLAYVKGQLNVDDLSTSTSLPDQIINTSINIPAQAYFSLTLIVMLIAILCYRFKKMSSKITLIIVLVLSLIPGIFYATYVKNINYAVALKEVPLYEGPSKIFNEKGKIRPGSKIVLGEFKDGWFFVEFPLSLAGWVNKDQLGLY